MKETSFSVWINEDEKRELDKLKRKAKKENRSLSNFCKNKLFNNKK